MATDIIARGMASSAGGGGGGGDLPDASKEGQVLTSNAQKKPVWSNVAPLADNLLASPINNDAMYSSGPTGGLADITTGEEAYLQEIKGMSIVWNQLVDTNTTTFVPNSNHIYIMKAYTWSIIQNSSSSVQIVSNTWKIFDLTLMFGGNDKIPFSFAVNEVEYPVNGTIPSQIVNAVERFQRLFANVDLANAPYDAGTIKNVKATKLVETGRNLWDASTMKTTGLQLLANYGYEIYIKQSAQVRRINVSFDNGLTWSNQNLNRYQRADGKYIWYYKPGTNCLIKPVNDLDSFNIEYVGFVHSGNYCLTTGTVNNSNYAYTDATIPPYVKHEFSIDGIDGLNGLIYDSNTMIYDTKDYRRVGSIDLSEYQNMMAYDDDEGGWVILTENLPNDFFVEATNFVYLSQKGYVIYQYVPEDTSEGISIISSDSVNKPTGILLYELTEPVATGEPAFEPIALKSGNEYVVDDMGSEYFIQPANTNCPVNQVSYYYENLKDKLQNLQDPIEVAAASYDYSKSALNGLKIGNNYYRLVEQGYISARSDVAIGNNAGCYSSNCVSLGVSAQTNSYNNIAIGVNSNSNGTDSIAIGYQTRSVIPYGVCFDGPTSRTYHCYSPEKIFFRNDISNFNKNTFESYTLGHYLSEYVQNQALVLQDGKYYISYTDADNFKTFSNNRVSGTDNDITSTVKGVHLVVKLSNDNIASLDLLPYDTTNSKHFTAYGIASDTPTFVSAYIDANGCVVLTLPTGITAEEVLYTLK